MCVCMHLCAREFDQIVFLISVAKSIRGGMSCDFISVGEGYEDVDLWEGDTVRAGGKQAVQTGEQSQRDPC